MRVTVQYMAQVRQAAGTASEEVELAGPCSVAELIAGVAERHGGGLRRLLLGADGGPQPTVLLFVGDEQVGRADAVTLQGGEVVTVLSPIAGG